MEKLTCARAKKIDLTDYLASLGYLPQKIRSQDYWYLSPFREEKTASFKVNRKLNVWYDHALGKGGDLIDFGILYFKCTVSDLLQKLSQQPVHSFSFHPPTPYGNQPTLAGEKKEKLENKIIIAAIRPLKDEALLACLNQRHISLAAAQPYLREVDFLLYGRQKTVIGFQNNAGGYELRSADFKGSSSPKDITFMDAGAQELTVFEGFFNFLSFQSAACQPGQQLTNFLVLNSLSFFEKSRPLMEQHRHVNLYLDRDKAGLNSTQQALTWNREVYTDQSCLYQQYKDLNQWLISKPPDNRQKQAKRLRLGKRL